MNIRLLLTLQIVIALALASCAAPPATLLPSSTPTLPPPPTATPTPPPPTPTPLPPTDTPLTPTETPPTPIATFTAAPTATPNLEPTQAVDPCAAAPSISGNSQYRLTIVNKSGYVVFMELEIAAPMVQLFTSQFLPGRATTPPQKSSPS